MSFASFLLPLHFWHRLGGGGSVYWCPKHHVDNSAANVHTTLDCTVCHYLWTMDVRIKLVSQFGMQISILQDRYQLSGSLGTRICWRLPSRCTPTSAQTGRELNDSLLHNSAHSHSAKKNSLQQLSPRTLPNRCCVDYYAMRSERASTTVLLSCTNHLNISRC